MYLKNNGNKPVTLGKQTIMPDQSVELPSSFEKNSVVSLLLRRGDLVSVVEGETISDKSTEKKTSAKTKAKSGTKSDKKETDKEDSKTKETDKEDSKTKETGKEDSKTVEESSSEQTEKEAELSSTDRQIPGL